MFDTHEPSYIVFSLTDSGYHNNICDATFKLLKLSRLVYINISINHFCSYFSGILSFYIDMLFLLEECINGNLGPHIRNITYSYPTLILYAQNTCTFTSSHLLLHTYVLVKLLMMRSYSLKRLSNMIKFPIFVQHW